MDRVEVLLEEFSRINNELLTGQRAAYRELARTAAARERAQRYVGMLAHDLNSPLTVILGYVEELLADDALRNDQRHMLERVERSALLIRSLVSEIGTGFDAEVEERYDPQPVPFRGLVESVVSRHLLLSAGKQISLVLAGPSPGAPGGDGVLGDFVQLERVLNNLIGNAVKYSPAGTEVRVEVEADEEAVRTRVIDQGPGIAEDAHERVFEMFHREPGALREEGLGLGLFISRRIAEKHGGSLAVTSCPGHGATFTLTLPRWTADRS